MKAIVEKLKAIDKRILIYLGVLIGLIIIALIVSKIIYIVGNSNKSYSEVETILREAGIKYYKDNTSSLPVEDGETSSVADNVLSDEGYMKSLDKLIKNNNCSGKVTVTKKEDLYSYSSYLDCGKTYQTKEFYKKLLEKTVQEKDGLYETDKGYVFRGENPNNYIRVDDMLWRIISIGEDNSIEIMLDEPVELIVWDNRYNSDQKYKSGYNNFESSRLYQQLKDLYDGNLLLNGKVKLFSDNLRPKMIYVNNCLDKRKETDKDFSVCEKTNNQLVSIISIDEYIKASIDPKCVSAGNADCQNYNYLVKSNSYWTITGDASSSSNVYQIRGGGAIYLTYGNNLEDIYPVIRLSNSLMYSSGNGKQSNPYIVR